MNEFLISLVLCTIGQTDHVDNFIRSLLEQDYSKFELIIIDQNTDNRVINIVEKYQKFDIKIKHIKSKKGLSVSRNVGLKYIEGDIIAFPDDDCTYSPKMLNKINQFFQEKQEYDGLVIRAKNSIETGRELHKWDKSQIVTKKNVIGLVHSISLFLKKQLVESVGNFDENLGLGAKTVFQGQEDRDYPLRALGKGFKLYFDREIVVLHPWDDEEVDKSKNLEVRAFRGAAAEMYLLNKHQFGFFYKTKRVCRKCLAIIYFVIVKRNLYKAKASYNGLKGYLQYFNYTSSEWH